MMVVGTYYSYSENVFFTRLMFLGSKIIGHRIYKNKNKNLSTL